ncbi:MAG TPA: RlmE family RNA methyltransferase [Burkholderiales bacterium]|jgi:23S rRNA (uridine2552-2'-O)-methyltransferase|nr:RlmE family RNA methyltransferase [Burkholderiales bacterium]
MAKSNKQWLRRHVTDPYVRKAREQGYRSRSAFKLLEIDDKEKLLRPGATVVDLGAAPGGWSQVAAARVKPGGRVIAIDLLKIAPITGVEMMQGDFRAAKLEGVRADIVLSDLAPNLSGVANVDQARGAELAFAAIDFCRKMLKPDGVFVVKTFHGEAFGEVLARLKREFGKVMVRKPSASRGESSETYVVARGLLAL